MKELEVVIQFPVGLVIRLYRDFCQCHMVGRGELGEARFPQNQGWHYPGTFFSNALGRHHQLVNGSCRYLHANWPYPEAAIGQL